MYRVAFWLLGLIMAVTPLAFGTVEQWSLTLVETLCLVLFTLTVAAITKDKDNGFRKIPGTLPIMLAIAYMVFQIMPLPHLLIGFLSPHTADIYGRTVWAITPDSWVPLALDRKAAVLNLFMFVSCATVYFSAVHLFSRRPGMRGFIAFLIVFVTVISGLSILEHIWSHGTVFWVRQAPKGAHPFGPYVNRNHYAGFVNMIFAIALALLFVSRPKVYGWTFREKLAGVLGSREANLYLLLALGTFIMGTSVFLSLSRGGIISLCIAVMLLAIAMKLKLAKKSAYTLLVFALLFGAVGWFGWKPIIERFAHIPVQEISETEYRAVMWKNSLVLIKQYPMTGVGFGGFEDAYRTLPSAEHGKIVQHAHNDYLELLADGGGIGFLLFAWFMLSVLLASIRKLKSRQDPRMIALSLGAMAGMMAILVHGVVDFNLHIGANRIYFFFLAALAVSASHVSSRRGRSQSLLAPYHGLNPKAVLVVAGLLTVLVTAVNPGVLVGQIEFSSVKDLYLSSMTDKQTLVKVKEAADYASKADPLEATYPFAQANVLELLGNSDEAVAYYYKAIERAPLSAEYLDRAAKVSAELSEVGRAGILIQDAVSVEPANPRYHKSYAKWLIQNGQRSQGIAQLRTAISLEPEKTRDDIAFMILLGLDIDEQTQAIPQTWETLLLFGDYLAQVDRYELAEKTYLNAIGHLDETVRTSQGKLVRIATFFNSRHRYEDALMVLKKTLEYLPETAYLQIQLGMQYEKMEMPYQAVQAFKQALVLDPGNRTAKMHLTQLAL